MKVLLAIDGSKYSDAAVEELANRVWPEGTEIMVLSVVHIITEWPDPIFYGVRLMAFEDHRREARSVVNKATTKLMEKFGSEKLHIIGEILEGSPKKLIVKESASWNADLIIVGSHGRGAIEKALLGSVSSYVSSHAKCSVEVVHFKEAMTAVA